MSDEEYVSTHDLISEKLKSEFRSAIGLGAPQPIKTQEVPNATELEDIRKSQRYILDKLSSMDRFLRGSQFRYGGKVMDGEAYRREVIEKFLGDLRDGTGTVEDKEMFKMILSQKPKPKEIEEDAF